jgi:hypothetical protein
MASISLFALACTLRHRDPIHVTAVVTTASATVADKPKKGNGRSQCRKGNLAFIEQDGESRPPPPPPATPAVLPAGPGGPPAFCVESEVEPNPLGLSVGWDGVIKLWAKPIVGQATVRYAVPVGGYPSRAWAQYVADEMGKAAKQWNEQNVGVQFHLASHSDDAAFVIVYGGVGAGLYAKAFPPSNYDLEMLYVYGESFHANVAPHLHRIFLHELGHVLGLRHEYPVGEGRAVQLGERNPSSVMNSSRGPAQLAIQPSDIALVKELYESTADVMKGFPVKRYEPNN